MNKRELKEFTGLCTKLAKTKTILKNQAGTVGVLLVQIDKLEGQLEELKRAYLGQVAIGEFLDNPSIRTENCFFKSMKELEPLGIDITDLEAFREEHLESGKEELDA